MIAGVNHQAAAQLGIPLQERTTYNQNPSSCERGLYDSSERVSIHLQGLCPALCAKAWGLAGSKTLLASANW